MAGGLAEDRFRVVLVIVRRSVVHWCLGDRRLISGLSWDLVWRHWWSFFPWVRSIVFDWRRILAGTWCADGSTELWPVVGTRGGTYRKEALVVSSNQRWRARLDERYLGYAADLPWWQNRMMRPTE